MEVLRFGVPEPSKLPRLPASHFIAFELLEWGRGLQTANQPEKPHASNSRQVHALSCAKSWESPEMELSGQKRITTFQRPGCPGKSVSVRASEFATKNHPGAPSSRSQSFTPDLPKIRPQEEERPRKPSLPQAPGDPNPGKSGFGTFFKHPALGTQATGAPASHPPVSSVTADPQPEAQGEGCAQGPEDPAGTG